MRREPLGWRELARATIGPDGTVSGVSSLLRAAGGGPGKAKPRVTLWLPPAQVLIRHIALPEDPAARLTEARQDAAEATGQRPGDLAIDIAPAGADGVSVVVSAFAQSCREACAYAEGWGFHPIAVSTHVEAAAFPPEGPLFLTRPESDVAAAGRQDPEDVSTDMPDDPAEVAAVAHEPTIARAEPEPTTDKDGAPKDGAPKAAPASSRTNAVSGKAEQHDNGASGARRRSGALVVLALLSGAVIFSAPWKTEAPEQLATAPQAPSSAQDRLEPVNEPPSTSAGAVPQVETPEDRASTEGEPREVAAIESEAEPAISPAEPAPELPQPAEAASPDDLASVEVARGSPPHALPLPSLAAPPPSTAPSSLGETPLPAEPPALEVFADLRTAIEGLQEETVAPPDDAQDTEVKNGRGTLWKQAPAARNGESPSLAARALATTEGSTDAPGRETDAPASDVARAEIEAGPQAPVESTAPRRRPGTDDAAEDEAPVSEQSPDASGPDSEDVASTDDDDTVSSLAPPTSLLPRLRGQKSDAEQPEPESEAETAAQDGTGSVPEAAAPEAEPAAAEDADPPTERAAAAAPPPQERPDNLGAPIRPSPQTGGAVSTVPALPPIGRSAPKKVQRAAVEQGIPLDRMALIGVLNLETGRQALLRLPNGRYERLKIGDTVEGWQVSTIGADTMRLSRNGEERTLILVNR